MPYTKRDEQNKIIDTSCVETNDHQEFLPQENEEVFEFNKNLAEESAGKPLNYRDKRRYAFPSVGDQLDAIAKTFKYMWDNGVDIGPVGEAFIKQLRDVKNRFPKD
jgi:hypothetical protein